MRLGRRWIVQVSSENPWFHAVPFLLNLSCIKRLQHFLLLAVESISVSSLAVQSSTSSVGDALLPSSSSSTDPGPTAGHVVSMRATHLAAQGAGGPAPHCVSLLAELDQSTIPKDNSRRILSADFCRHAKMASRLRSPSPWHQPQGRATPAVAQGGPRQSSRANKAGSLTKVTCKVQNFAGTLAKGGCWWRTERSFPGQGRESAGGGGIAEEWRPAAGCGGGRRRGPERGRRAAGLNTRLGPRSCSGRGGGGPPGRRGGPSPSLRHPPPSGRFCQRTHQTGARYGKSVVTS